MLDLLNNLYLSPRAVAASLLSIKCVILDRKVGGEVFCITNRHGGEERKCHLYIDGETGSIVVVYLTVPVKLFFFRCRTIFIN